MGGGGAMGMANNSLKYNRSLIGKREYKDAKNLIISESGKTELEFKEVNAIELRKIKDRIRQKAKRRTINNLLLFTIILLISLSIIIYIFIS